MMRSAFLPVLMGWMLAPVPLLPAALAQPAPAGRSVEQVIVTAPRILATPNAQAHDFIRSFATPSTLLGELPRWRQPICPRTDGLSRDEYTSFVTQRVRAVAALAGARVAPTPCKPNIEILFTDKPQAMLDGIRDSKPDLLGYKPAASISHPIQAWYVTKTVDVEGHAIADEDPLGTFGLSGSGSSAASLAPGKTGSGFIVMIPAEAFGGVPVSTRMGSLLRPGLQSEFANVLVIADSSQTASHRLGAVADYVALLALSQSQRFETCEGVPSVANEMAAGCPDTVKPDAISASDIGFLRGVYAMDPGATLQVQEDQIAGEMLKAGR
jgi:hypothetical protein